MENPKSKFADIPCGSDTRMLYQKEVKLGEYDCLFEVWSWDGILANSFAFLSNDIKDITDEELIALLKASPIWEGRDDLRVNRGTAGFTFVTFNGVSWGYPA